MKLVATNIPAAISAIMPIVPPITSVKNKTNITVAKISRIILSIFPMFFFITSNIKCQKYLYEHSDSLCLVSYATEIYRFNLAISDLKY